MKWKSRIQYSQANVNNDTSEKYSHAGTEAAVSISFKTPRLVHPMAISSQDPINLSHKEIHKELHPKP
jgi:hypothetical protein